MTRTPLPPTVAADLARIIDERCYNEQVQVSDWTVDRLIREKPGVTRAKAVRILREMTDEGLFVKMWGQNPETGRRVLIFRPVAPKKKGK